MEKKENKIVSLDEDQEIILVSADLKEIPVSKLAISKASEVINSMLEKNSNISIIDLPIPLGSTLLLIADYAEHHLDHPSKEIKTPIESNDINKLVSPWDAEFMLFITKNNTYLDTLLDLLLASNYLDMSSLVDLCTVEIASLLKGKTREQMRKTFNIVNDFTPEQEKAVIEETKWAEQL